MQYTVKRQSGKQQKIFLIFEVSFFFQKKLSPRYKKVRDKVGALNSSVFNNLLGIQTIKSFMSFHKEKLRVSDLSQDYQN